MAIVQQADHFSTFQELVWKFYREHGRNVLPWRQTEAAGQLDPYKILVSEVMLQQTPVARVVPKYPVFVAQFPNVQALAQASLGEVLSVWNGLGYNRRARFLWLAARKIVMDFGGELPQNVSQLRQLPGVGPNTAGAILVYAFNMPVVFIETNTRSVFIHHFFKDQKRVADKSILKLVEKTMDIGRPREWFWGLMDYGSYLKQTVGNLSQASQVYAKQPRFAGSRRQLRGQVIRQLVVGPVTRTKFHIADERLDGVLADLIGEGLIQQNGHTYSLFAGTQRVLD